MMTLRKRIETCAAGIGAVAMIVVQWHAHTAGATPGLTDVGFDAVAGGMAAAKGAVLGAVIGWLIGRLVPNEPKSRVREHGKADF